MPVKFSIIIPAYNAEKHLGGCLESLVGQQPGDYQMEALFIDDHSTDNTIQLLREFEDRHKKWVRIYQNEKNLGLGLTRNVGIEHASGEWLIFLDSDDALSPEALQVLAKFVLSADSSTEVVGFNWSYDGRSGIKNDKYGGRWDLGILRKGKPELIKEYISLGMEHSVIYATFKKSMLIEHNLRFREGLHEDIEFTIRAYCYSQKIGALDKPLYLKNNREGSIVNSISEDHIMSFFRALKEIRQFLESRNMLSEEIKQHYLLGIMRVVATEARYIWQRHGAEEWAENLYSKLYNEFVALPETCNIRQIAPERGFEPKYLMIARRFLAIMNSGTKRISGEIADYLGKINEKSWSCYDLHNSVFLTPDEIRVCCKRFFVNNIMKGDVVLLDGNRYKYADFTPENILKEKRGLHVGTNVGTAKDCLGCPYLEFKKWKPIDELKIEYLSLEYNNRCNMRCTYCSEKFNGGKKTAYDVERLLNQLLKEGGLSDCRTMMWGGGEPTLDGLFDDLITLMADHFPDVKQRVFTNATGYSETIARLLKEDKIISITSIDAGTEEIFRRIRKHPGFFKVLENLKSYSLARPENMIIKYIITEKNGSLGELRSFAQRIQEYSLEKCNFQISINFKEEKVKVDSLISAIALYTYLLDIGVRYIFFDDLFWQRISKELTAQYAQISSRIKQLDLERAFADNQGYKSIVIWGAGIQAKYLIEKANFFKKVKIEHLVDNSNEKAGKEYYGYRVLRPESLLESDFPVVVAAVQNIPSILSNYYKLGLPESRLVKGLVI